MESQANDDPATVEKPRRVVSLAGSSSFPGFGYGGKKIDLNAGVLERLMGPLTSAEPRQQSGSAVCRFYPDCRAGSRCQFKHADPVPRGRRHQHMESRPVPQSWKSDAECRECGCTVSWGQELCPRCVDITPEATPERWQPSSPSVECRSPSPRRASKASSRAVRRKKSSSSSKSSTSSSASSSSPSSSSSASSDSRRRRSSVRSRRRESLGRRSRSRSRK
mmetsp:Transcript_41370/g.87720  ORF Transcript_41370/g.87720 Transcript_41370/m.87720 type:complete len:221 (+) Transcript_41370:193-855(+)